MSRSARRLVALLLTLSALAFAVYRVERDQPSWLRPSLWGTARPRMVLRAPPPLVLAFHYPWYGTPWGPTGRWRKWNHQITDTQTDAVLGFHDPTRVSGSGLLAIAATHYPAAGPYDSRDPKVILRQIREARTAGLDGFIVSWWGVGSDEDLTFQAMLDVAVRENFPLTIYYETGELGRAGGSRVARDLETVLDRYGTHPAFLKLRGIPVLFLYATHRLRVPVWEYVLRRLHAGGRRAFLVGDSIRPRWLERFDGLHFYSPVPLLVKGETVAESTRRWSSLARDASLLYAATVTPGFDDRIIRRPGTQVDRRNGAFYEETWRVALSTRPDWILISSWNEWHEGTEIEPSREHGGTYVTLTRRWAERFREQRSGGTRGEPLATRRLSIWADGKLSWSNGKFADPDPDR